MKRIPFLFLLLATIFLSGCKVEEGGTEKIKDLEFTVVKEEEIPDRLVELIAQNKEEPFKLTYSDDSCLYIAQGYGKQESGGYSVQVLECYLTGNSVVFKSNLLGPKDKSEAEVVSYPYIVIKTEYRDEMVVFQ